MKPRHIAPLLGLLCLALGGQALAAPASKADLVKVAMIEKIVRFIDWPTAPAAQFVLCVPTDHPQITALHTYYDNAQILNLPVQIRVLRKGEPLSPCRAVLLLPSENPDMPRLQSLMAKENVLLIAEGAAMAKLGVHIGFFADMNKIRLEVNRKSLEASGLKVSYKLLEVAKIVE